MKTIQTVIFAKAPIPGLAKTRLGPALGPDGAANLAKKMLEHCISQALAADIGPVELCVAPSMNHPVWRELTIPSAVLWSEQGEGDLGERLARAAQRVTACGDAVLLIGSDCPQLTSSLLKRAALALQENDACMVPVSDGGYALLGLNHYLPSLFVKMPWSTDGVSRLTQQRLKAEGWRVRTLEVLHDIDEPQDLQYLPEKWLL